LEKSGLFSMLSEKYTVFLPAFAEQ
jgi:hypothetical protein